MYVELVLYPYMLKVGGLFMVWDNCGPHCSRAVRELCARLGIDVLALLPNTTANRQVCDVGINGPFKVFVRKLRIAAFWELFCTWRDAFNAWMAAPGAAPRPVLVIPAPSRLDLVNVALGALEALAARENHAASITNTMVRCGQIPAEDGRYVPFAPPSLGSLTVPLASSIDGVPGMITVEPAVPSGPRTSSTSGSGSCGGGGGGGGGGAGGGSSSASGQPPQNRYSRYGLPPVPAVPAIPARRTCPYLSYLRTCQRARARALGTRTRAPGRVLAGW